MAIIEVLSSPHINKNKSLIMKTLGHYVMVTAPSTLSLTSSAANAEPTINSIANDDSRYLFIL